MKDPKLQNAMVQSNAQTSSITTIEQLATAFAAASIVVVAANQNGDVSNAVPKKRRQRYRYFRSNVANTKEANGNKLTGPAPENQNGDVPNAGAKKTRRRRRRNPKSKNTIKDVANINKTPIDVATENQNGAVTNAVPKKTRRNRYFGPKAKAKAKAKATNKEMTSANEPKKNELNSSTPKPNTQDIKSPANLLNHKNGTPSASISTENTPPPSNNIPNKPPPPKPTRRRGGSKKEFVFRDLPMFEPSPEIKQLTKLQFHSNGQLTKKEEDILLNIKTFTELTPQNYTDTLSMLIEIEDYGAQMDRYRFDKRNRSLKAIQQHNCYALNLRGTETPPLFLQLSDKVYVTPLAEKNKGDRVHGFVFRKSDKFILIRTVKRLDCTRQHTVHFILNRITYRLEHMAVVNAKNLQISTLLFPVKANNYTPKNLKLELFEKRINGNKEQKQAVQHIVEGSAYPAPYLLVGLPGTGKTQVIVESIYQLWLTQPDSRILVCAPSNGVVDEIAIRLLNSLRHIGGSQTLIGRLYASSAQGNVVDSRLKSISIITKGTASNLVTEIIKLRVVLCTCAAAGRISAAAIAADHFTHLFIDECESAGETITLIPIAGVCSSVGKIHAQIIVSGDIKQLGPIVVSEVAENLGYGTSMLERLMRNPIYNKNALTNAYDCTLFTKLINNYRSHPSILNLSNELFYENEMIPCANILKIAMASNLPTSSALFPTGIKQYPIMFVHVDGHASRLDECYSWFNDPEIMRVSQYYQALLETKKFEPSDIGIITPYKRQSLRIEEQASFVKMNQLKIGSVELFQGQERQVIIATTVRTRASKLGFITDPKRINVLLTRAISLLIIIGDATNLVDNRDWKRVIDYTKENNTFVNVER